MTLVRAARAFAFGAPLAILAASVIGPPDPLSQLVNVGLGILLFVPAAYVSVAQNGNSRTLVTFYGTIILVVLLGAFIVGLVDGGEVLRSGVLVVAVVAGALVVDRGRVSAGYRTTPGDVRPQDTSRLRSKLRAWTSGTSSSTRAVDQSR